jgi:uncharacterized protein YjbI with pentapeptide repeats
MAVPPATDQPDADAVHLLRTDVHRYNAERLTHPSYANLVNADLHELHLMKANLFDADLRGANLSRANLSNAVLERARLDGAILQGAVLRGAVVTHTSLQAPVFEDVDFRGADLRSSTWPHVRFVRSDLRQVQLGQSDLTGFEMRECLLDELTFSQSRAAGAQIIDCQLSNGGAGDTDLTRARIQLKAPNLGVNFSGARLPDAELVSRLWVSPAFVQAELPRARFVEAVLNYADFGGADLTGAVFRGAHLRGGDFTGARAAGADFTGAVLEGVRFVGADLSRARFDGARLTGKVLFNRAQLDGASFSGIDDAGAEVVLDGTVFAGGKLPR